MSVSFSGGLVYYTLVVDDVRDFVYYTSLPHAHTTRPVDGVRMEIKWGGVDALEIMSMHEVDTNVMYHLIKPGACFPDQVGDEIYVAVLGGDPMFEVHGVTYYGTGVVLHVPTGYSVSMKNPNTADLDFRNHREVVVGFVTGTPVPNTITLNLEVVVNDSGSVCGETRDGAHLLIHDNDPDTAYYG